MRLLAKTLEFQRIAIWLAVLLVALGGSAFGGSHIETVASGLSAPTAVQYASDGKLYILDSNGITRRETNGTLTSIISQSGIASFHVRSNGILYFALVNNGGTDIYTFDTTNENAAVTLHYFIMSCFDPGSIAVDPSGTVFLEGQGGFFKLDSDLQLTQFDLSCDSGAYIFDDDSGTIYVCNGTYLAIYTPGSTWTYPSTYISFYNTYGNGGNIAISQAGWVIVPGQQIFSVEFYNGSIYYNGYIIAGDGTVGYYGDGGSPLNAGLSNPFGVCFGNTSNELYIADTGNNAVRIIYFESQPVLSISADCPFAPDGPQYGSAFLNWNTPDSWASMSLQRMTSNSNEWSTLTQSGSSYSDLNVLWIGDPPDTTATYRLTAQNYCGEIFNSQLAVSLSPTAISSDNANGLLKTPFDFTGTAQWGTSLLSVAIDGTPLTPLGNNGTWPNFSVPIGTLADGPHMIGATLADSLGNITIQVFSFIADSTPPDAVITSPVNGAVMNSGTLTITVVYSENVNLILDGAVLQVLEYTGTNTFVIYPTLSAEGTHTLVLEDDAHNQVSPVIFVADWSPPLITPHNNVLADTSSTQGVVVNYGAASVSDNVCASPSVSYSKASGTSFPVGTTTVTITATDDAGNSSNSDFTVTVRLIPYITSISPDSCTTGSGPLTLTVTGSNFVSNSIVKFKGQPLDTTYVNSTTITATIPAGQLISPGDFNVTVINGIDSNAVQLHIVLSLTVDFRDRRNFVLGWQFDPSCQSYSLERHFEGGNFTEFSTQVASVADIIAVEGSKQYYRLKSTYETGVFYSPIITVCVNPAVQIVTNVQPAPDSLLAEDHCSIEATAAYEEVAKILLDGVTLQKNGNGTSVSASASDLPDGQHSAGIVIQNSGDVSARFWRFVTDTHAPRIEHMMPLDGRSVFLNSPALTIYATDEISGVDWESLIVLINGEEVYPTPEGLISASDAISGKRAVITPDGPLGTGSHTYEFWVQDFAGNTANGLTHFTIRQPGQSASAPTNLVATPLHGPAVTLTWTDNSNNETSFIVLRSESSAGPFIEIASTAADESNYTDSSLSDAGRFWYKVLATNNDSDSDASNSVRVAWPLSPSTPVLTVSGLRRIQIDWTQGVLDFVDGFIIEKQNTDGQYEMIADVPASNQTSYSFIDNDIILYEVPYYYRIQAYGWIYASDYSAEATITVPYPTIQISAEVLDKSLVRFTRDALAGYDTYVLERSDNANGTFISIAPFAGMTVIDNPGLQATRYYRIHGMSGIDEGFSSSISVCINPSAPAFQSESPLPFTVQQGFSIFAFTQLGGAYKVILDGNSLTPIDTTYGIGAMATNVSEGSHTAGISATNTDGDVIAQFWDFKVDLHAPAISKVLPLDGRIVFTDQPAIEIKAVDSISGVDWETLVVRIGGLEIYPDENGGPASTASFSSDTATLTLANGLDYGSHTVTFSLADHAGNIAFGSTNFTVQAQDVPPTAPSGLTASSAMGPSVHLTWLDNSSNELGFVVVRATSENGSYDEIALLGPGSTTYSDSGVTPASTYWYAVLATNEGGDSAASARATTGFPIAPTHLTAALQSATVVLLTWSHAGENVDSFYIERRASEGNWISIGSVSGLELRRYTDESADSASLYSYRVRAGKDSYRSDPSSVWRIAIDEFPQLKIFPSHAFITQNGGVVALEVSRDFGLQGDLRVKLKPFGGTADPAQYHCLDSDGNTLGDYCVIPATLASCFIYVQGVPAFHLGDRFVHLELDVDYGYILAAQCSSDVTIVDTVEPIPIISLTTTKSTTMPDGKQYDVFRITKSIASGTVNVPVTMSSGQNDAVLDTDYRLYLLSEFPNGNTISNGTGTLNIASAQTDILVVPVITSMRMGENPVTLTLAQNAGQYYLSEPTHATIMIAPDAPVLSITPAAKSIVEGNGSQTSFRISMEIGSLSNPESALQGIISKHLMDDSGQVVPGDWPQSILQQIVSESPTSYLVKFNPQDDGLATGNRRIVVSLQQTTGNPPYLLGNAQAQVSLIDKAPTVSVVTSLPAATPTMPGEFKFTRSGLVESVNFTISSTATRGEAGDYILRDELGVLISGNAVQFREGVDVFFMKVVPLHVPDGDKIVGLSLDPSNAYSIGGSSGGSVTLLSGPNVPNPRDPQGPPGADCNKPLSAEVTDLAIIGGKTGDKDGTVKVNGQNVPASFTNKKEVIVRVNASAQNGKIQSVTVYGGSDAATVPGNGAASGRFHVSVQVANEGVAVLTASVTATNDCGMSASASLPSDGARTLIVDHTNPKIRYTLPLKYSNKDDESIVYINGNEPNAQSPIWNVEFRQKYGYNYYHPSEFAVTGTIDDFSGVTLKPETKPHYRIHGDGFDGTVEDATPQVVTFPAATDLALVQESILLNGFTALPGAGRYTFDIKLTDRCGNVLDTSSDLRAAEDCAFKLWVDRTPPPCALGDNAVIGLYGIPEHRVHKANAGGQDGKIWGNKAFYVVSTFDAAEAWQTGEVGSHFLSTTDWMFKAYHHPTQLPTTGTNFALVTSETSPFILRRPVSVDGDDNPFEVVLRDAAGNFTLNPITIVAAKYTGDHDSPNAPPQLVSAASYSFPPVFTCAPSFSEPESSRSMSLKIHYTYSHNFGEGSGQVETEQPAPVFGIAPTAFERSEIKQSPTTNWYFDEEYNFTDLLFLSNNAMKNSIHEYTVLGNIPATRSWLITGPKESPYKRTPEHNWDARNAQPGLARVMTYFVHTGYHWGNCVKVSPDVVATGTKTTVRIAGGFLCDSGGVSITQNYNDFYSGPFVQILPSFIANIADRLKIGSDLLVLQADTENPQNDPGKITLLRDLSAAGHPLKVRLVPDHKSPSLLQYLEFDVEIGRNVAPQNYNVSVCLGAVCKYELTGPNQNQYTPKSTELHTMPDALSVIKFDIVTPVYNANGEWTGELTADQLPRAAESYPTVVITSHSETISTDGQVSASISGYVSDAFADIIKNSGGDIKGISFGVGSTTLSAVQLTRDSSYENANKNLIRPFAYRSVPFNQTVTFAASTNSDVLWVRTSPNVCGKSGSSGVSISYSNTTVNLDGRLSPVYPAGVQVQNTLVWLKLVEPLNAGMINSMQLHMGTDGGLSPITLHESGNDTLIFQSQFNGGTLRVALSNVLPASLNAVVSWGNLGADQGNLTLAMTAQPGQSQVYTTHLPWLSSFSGGSNDWTLITQQIPNAAAIDQITLVIPRPNATSQVISLTETAVNSRSFTASDSTLGTVTLSVSSFAASDANYPATLTALSGVFTLTTPAGQTMQRTGAFELITQSQMSEREPGDNSAVFGLNLLTSTQPSATVFNLYLPHGLRIDAADTSIMWMGYRNSSVGDLILTETGNATFVFAKADGTGTTVVTLPNNSALSVNTVDSLNVTIAVSMNGKTWLTACQAIETDVDTRIFKAIIAEGANGEGESAASGVSPANSVTDKSISSSGITSGIAGGPFMPAMVEVSGDSALLDSLEGEMFDNGQTYHLVKQSVGGTERYFFGQSPPTMFVQKLTEGDAPDFPNVMRWIHGDNARAVIKYKNGTKIAEKFSGYLKIKTTFMNPDCTTPLDWGDIKLVDLAHPNTPGVLQDKVLGIKVQVSNFPRDFFSRNDGEKLEALKNKFPVRLYRMHVNAPWDTETTLKRGLKASGHPEQAKEPEGREVKLDVDGQPKGTEATYLKRNFEIDGELLPDFRDNDGIKSFAGIDGDTNFFQGKRKIRNKLGATTLTPVLKPWREIYGFAHDWEWEADVYYMDAAFKEREQFVSRGVAHPESIDVTSYDEKGIPLLIEPDAKGGRVWGRPIANAEFLAATGVEKLVVTAALTNVGEDGSDWRYPGKTNSYADHILIKSPPHVFMFSGHAPGDPNEARLARSGGVHWAARGAGSTVGKVYIQEHFNSESHKVGQVILIRCHGLSPINKDFASMLIREKKVRGVFGGSSYCWSNAQLMWQIATDNRSATEAWRLNWAAFQVGPNQGHKIVGGYEFRGDELKSKRLAYRYISGGHDNDKWGTVWGDANSPTNALFWESLYESLPASGPNNVPIPR